MPKIEDRKGTDQIVSQFTITCRENGSMEIAGPIDNTEYALAVLENAKDAVRNRRSLKDVLTIPGTDVTLPKVVL